MSETEDAPEAIRSAVAYFQRGGLVEMTERTLAAMAEGRTVVECDADGVLALCHLAAGALAARAEAVEEITREQFIERFVARMLRAGPTFADGSSIEEYAREVAPTYWSEESQRECGPEECAEGDMDCWENA